MFEDCGFEVYESTTKTYQVKEIYEAIDGPSRQMLRVREVLEEIKIRFYALEELTADMDHGSRHVLGNRCLRYLQKLTDPIRRLGTEQALAELRGDGHKPEVLELANRDEADDSNNSYRSEDEG